MLLNNFDQFCLIEQLSILEITHWNG